MELRIEERGTRKCPPCSFSIRIRIQQKSIATQLKIIIKIENQQRKHIVLPTRTMFSDTPRTRRKRTGTSQ